jgi:hypothetical protein
MTAFGKSWIVVSFFVLAATLGAAAGVSGEPRSTRTVEFKAVRFSDSEEMATRELNVLAGQGWQYVGPLGKELVAFRRGLPINSAISLLQGDWEYLSFEKDGVVTEYKAEHRLSLSVSGDLWAVGDMVRHRVDVAGRDLVFHGTSGGIPGTGAQAPQPTVAFGLIELKGESLTYCMTTAFAASAFPAGNSPVKKPETFDTKGTENVVYRLRRKLPAR